MFKKGDRVLYHTTEGTRYGIYVGQGLKVGMIFHNKCWESQYIKLHQKAPDGWHVVQWSFRNSEWGYPYHETAANIEEKFERISRLTALIVLGCR